jgi:hypothetical protein
VEMLRIAGVPQPDSSEGCAAFLKFLLVLAQLRDVLTAEDSAVVTQKDHDCRATLPERPQSHGFAIDIRKRQICQFAAVGLSHGVTFSKATVGVSSAETRIVPGASMERSCVC